MVVEENTTAIAPATALEEKSLTSQAPTIPRLGFLCWLGPHDPPQDMMDTWPAKNPDMIWTVFRDYSEKAGWKNQDHINYRAVRREYNGVCDVIRYEILHRFGGIVVDADSICERPLSEGDFFEQTGPIACFEHEGVRPGLVGCGFLGAPAGHPFFAACVEAVSMSNKDDQAWKAVGPQLMTRMAARRPGELKVYPSRMFNPIHYSGTPAPGNATIFGSQGWGSTKSYASLRKKPCSCGLCRVNFCLTPPWG